MRKIPGARGAAPDYLRKRPTFENTSKLFQTRQTLSPGEPKHDEVTRIWIWLSDNIRIVEVEIASDRSCG